MTATEYMFAIAAWIIALLSIIWLADKLYKILKMLSLI